MKRTLAILTVAIVSFVLGAVCMYLLEKQPKPAEGDGWIAMTVPNYPIGYSLNYPIGTSPTPKAPALGGKIKFLTRDGGLQLGYKLKIQIESVPTKSLPLKDQAQQRLPDGSTIGPPDQLHLEGQFDFILKDADGFELQRVSALLQNLEAGADNERQGTADGVITQSTAERTKRVDVSFLVTSCYPCNK